MGAVPLADDLAVLGEHALDPDDVAVGEVAQEAFHVDPAEPDRRFHHHRTPVVVSRPDVGECPARPGFRDSYPRRGELVQHGELADRADVSVHCVHHEQTGDRGEQVQPLDGVAPVLVAHVGSGQDHVEVVGGNGSDHGPSAAAGDRRATDVLDGEQCDVVPALPGFLGDADGLQFVGFPAENAELHVYSSR